MRLFLLSLLLTSCATPPPNIFVFEDLAEHVYQDPNTHDTMLAPSPDCLDKINEFQCGHGVSIMTGDEIFVGEDPAHWWSGKPWSQLKQESVYLPAVESYAPLSTYVINSCKKNSCSNEVDRFKIRLGPLDTINKLP